VDWHRDTDRDTQGSQHDGERNATIKRQHGHSAGELGVLGELTGTGE